MRPSFAKLSIVVLLAVAAPAADAAAETLRLGGTGTAIGMLQKVGAEFTAADGGTINVVPNLGSAGAIKALADGVIDLAVSARPLKPDEAAAGMRQVAVMRTAYVLATSNRYPTALKSTDLPRIFATENAAWPDGKPIRIILRPRSETDTELLGKLFAGMGDAIESARRRVDVPVAATDQDNAALAERMPGSLTGITVTQLTTERRDMRIVPLDGLTPTLANVESGAYPFVKSLYFVIRSKDAAQAQRFVDYLRSPQGVQALRETETLPGIE